MEKLKLCPFCGQEPKCDLGEQGNTTGCVHCGYRLHAEYQMKLNISFIRENKGVAIAAWGAHGCWQQQDKKILKWFRDEGVPLYALGFTKDGHPRHPLYLKGDTKPVEFSI